MEKGYREVRAITGGLSSLAINCEAPSNSKWPRLDQGMQLQQLQTDTQPEAPSKEA